MRRSAAVSFLRARLPSPSLELGHVDTISRNDDITVSRSLARMQDR